MLASSLLGTLIVSLCDMMLGTCCNFKLFTYVDSEIFTSICFSSLLMMQLMLMLRYPLYGFQLQVFLFLVLTLCNRNLKSQL